MGQCRRLNVCGIIIMYSTSSTKQKHKSCIIFIFWGGGREETKAGEQIAAKGKKTGKKVSEEERTFRRLLVCRHPLGRIYRWALNRKAKSIWFPEKVLHKNYHLFQKEKGEVAGEGWGGNHCSIPINISKIGFYSWLYLMLVWIKKAKIIKPKISRNNLHHSAFLWLGTWAEY